MEQNNLYLLLEELKHHIDRLAEHICFKWVISAIGIALTMLFGNATAPMQAFLVLIAADYITGIIKAAKQGRLSSFLSRRGWGKLTTYTIVISLGHLISQIGVVGMRDFILLWAGATEAISIVENCDELGIYIPSFIRDRLLQTKNKFGG